MYAFNLTLIYVLSSGDLFPSRLALSLMFRSKVGKTKPWSLFPFSVLCIITNIQLLILVDCVHLRLSVCLITIPIVVLSFSISLPHPSTGDRWLWLMVIIWLNTIIHWCWSKSQPLQSVPEYLGDNDISMLSLLSWVVLLFLFIIFLQRIPNTQFFNLRFWISC